MSVRWPLVIFDFDGTLMDTKAGIIQAMSQTVTALDLPVSVQEQWQQMIGLALDTQVTLLLPGQTQAARDHMRDTYREFYRQLMVSHSLPFVGASALLGELEDAGLKLAIASSKRRWGIVMILEHLRWPFRFEPIVTPSEVTQPKPDPESIQLILKHHQLAPEQAILVGDSIFDIQTAVNSQITGCGVGWGVHEKTELLAAGAHHWVATFEELGALLLGT